MNENKNLINKKMCKFFKIGARKKIWNKVMKIGHWIIFKFILKNYVKLGKLLVKIYKSFLKFKNSSQKKNNKNNIRG